MDETRPRYCRGENVNLVHEAMAREATEDGKKPKKEEKKNVRTRFIATFLTWILLNLIWLYFSHAIAVNEVSKHDREVNGKYVSWSNFF